MFVFFFRHGDRLSGKDPSLSEMGQLQASRLPAFLEKNEIPIPQVLWVSPRKRSQQTFAVLAREKNLPCEIIKDLDERLPGESSAVFRARVQGVINRIPKVRKNIFLCSHFDWLEEAMSCIFDQGVVEAATLMWPAGGFIAFEIDDNNWMSTTTGQVVA